jgi:putative ABC transport system permease protein
MWRDVRLATRVLRRNPGFTTISVLTLALGIGGTTAIFSLVDSVLLRPLPYTRASELVSIKDDLPGLNLQDIGMSQPEFEDLRDRSGVFADISATWPISANLTGGERPERVEAVAVSPAYFSMLGARPQLGRIFGPQDRAEGFAEAAILSDGLWRRLYGGDPGVLGKQVRLDNDLYTVVGVMPPAFRHPGRTVATGVEVWITAGFRSTPFPKPPRRDVRMLPGAIARLQPGLSLSEAQQKLDAFAASLIAENPKEYPAASRWRLRATSLQTDLTGGVRTTLLVVFGAVVCVLLICCVSIANLAVAKAIGRQREMALRRAIGAPWSDLVRQFLTESVLLAMVGGGVGFALARFSAPFLPRLVPMELPVGEISVNGPVLWFALAATLLTGVVFGLAPVIPTMRTNIVGSLKEGSRGSTMGGAHSRLRAVLVGSEVAFSLVLMAGAGLLLHSFWNLMRVDPGFDPKRVITASLWLPVPNDPALFKYGNPNTRNAFMREVLRRAQTLPGVEAAAIGVGSATPLGGFNKVTFVPEGTNPAPGEQPVAEGTSVTPDFFRALGIRLVKGRVFTDADEGQKNPVAVVDETLARKVWPGQDPIGKRVGVGRGPVWMTVVGVVGAVKGGSLEEADVQHLYSPAFQRSGLAMTVFLRTAGNAAGLSESLRREVQAVDPELPVFGVRTMEEVVARSLAQRRFQLQMIGAFAAVALLLAALGIYGVTAFWVNQRMQEIGIRLALGAGGGDVVRMVLRQGLALTGWGIAAGIAGAAPLGSVLRSLLFGTTVLDPLTFAAVAALLLGTAALACYLPARRATRVDPMRALRAE